MTRPFLIPWLAACAGVSEGTAVIRIDCADNVSAEACNTGTLGRGGSLFYDAYDAAGELLPDTGLVSSDNAIARVEHDPSVSSIVGAGPGETEVLLVDDETVVARHVIRVGEVDRLDVTSTEPISGPLYDDTYDAAYIVPVDRAFSLSLAPQVGGARSIGYHLWQVAIDGSSSALVNEQRFWTDSVAIGAGLTAGAHVLELQSTDGGRDFTFRLMAR